MKVNKESALFNLAKWKLEGEDWMSQGQHTSCGEGSLKFKGGSLNQEKVNVNVAKKNTFGNWETKFLHSMQWLSKTGLGKSEVETSYLTSFEADFNKHKSMLQEE